jgi:hypothetical protein
MPASAEEIAQFREFSGDPSLPDIVASQYLDNSGGIEQAIGKYYDNSTLYTVHTVWLIDSHAPISTDRRP